jgi:23S rRNA (uracil1939-C5)-methyltransferase
MKMKSKVVKPVRFGDQIEIEIDSMAFGGDAVGRYQDFAVFIRGALPGERVVARVNLVKDHYAVAEVVSVLRPSADRVEPPCPIFEECGGCQWQHFDYPRQLLTKTQFVKDAIERIGKLKDITVNPCLGSPSTYAYRNKALPVLSMRDGHFVSGIYEPRSHQLVPYKTCPIQGDAINDLIQRVLRKIDQAGLTPYQEKSHTGFLRHLGVRQGFKTNELLLAFVTRTEIPEEKVQKNGLPQEELSEVLPRIARELMTEIPALVGVLQNVNSSRTNIVFGPQTKVLQGRDHYFEVIDGYKLKVSLQSFIQVNTGQADQLHEVVRKALGDPFHKKKWGTVLDLYSGIGTLALAVSEKAEYVIGVEEIVPAVEDARLNAKNNHRSNLEFLAGDVPQVLLDLKKQGLNQIDAVILDPPRKGVSPEVLARVAALHPERLVYVSCDPTTLARDLALLTQHGYLVEWAQPLDMFPQTYHVETVVRLTRDTPLPPDVSAKLADPTVLDFRLPKAPEPPPFDPTVWKERSERWGMMSAKGLAALGKFLLWLAAFAGKGLQWTWAVLSNLAIVAKEGWGSFSRQTAANLKERAEKQAYLKALEQENISKAQLLSNAIRLADLEIQLKDSLASAVKTQKKAKAEKKIEIKEKVKKSKLDWIPLWLSLPRVKLPQVRLPEWDLMPLMMLVFGNKIARWTVAAFFLMVGGYIATAKIAPLLSRSSVNPAFTQLMPDVIAIMPNRSFLRYEMVPFEVKFNTRDMANFSDTRATVVVYNGGQVVTTVGNRDKLVLKRDNEEGRLYGNWPIPYNPKAGTYLAELTVTSPEWKTPKVLRSAFTIPPLKPQGMYPGYATLTMEGGKQLINGAVPAIDGSESMRAGNAIQWAKFMGANCFCFLAGQTSIWDHIISRDFPFSTGDIDLAHKYAKSAHEAGMKFAAYITTFKVVGDAWNLAPYQFSLGYDKDNDQVVQTRFISLNDPKRRQDVIDILKKFDDDSFIDVVGLDYVRTGFAGYEMVDEFMKDLNVPAPAGYGSMTKDDRIHWLAKTVQGDKNHEVISLFEWWRAHKVALALKSILDEAKISKPVFTFTLGWQQGHQHGQDPAMFVDAGVNYNHIMLYEGDRGTLQSMNTQWPNYLSRGNGMYAMGEMVDFNWVQKSLNPPAPEELYNREVDTFENWFPMNARLGMFWHDLYRIVYGIRGPYSAMEWTIAGGKAFTTLKNAEGVLPIKVSLIVPKEIPSGVAVPMNIEVRNQSNQNLKGLTLHQLDTTKNYSSDLTTVGPFDIPAGHTMRFKNLVVTIPKDDEPERDNRYMTAVLVEQADTDLRAFDFVYVHRLGAKALRLIEHPEEQVQHTVKVHHSHKPKPVQPAAVQSAPVNAVPANAAPSNPAPAAPAPTTPPASDNSDSLGPLNGPGIDPAAGTAGNGLTGLSDGMSGGSSNPAPTPAGSPSSSGYDSQLLQNSILEQLPK